MKVTNYFSNYLEYLRQKGLAEHTIREHKRFLYGALSHTLPLCDKRIQDLKLTDCASIIESGKNHGEYGSQRAIVTFRQFLKFLKESGIKIPFDWRDIEVPRVPFKEQPVAEPKILNKIPTKTLWQLRERTLLEILFATGMRIGEALSLNKKDIDWKSKEAKVKGKGGDEGMVYFSDRSLEWLKKYLKMREDDYPALFVNQAGKERWSQVSARNYLRKYRKKWEIEKPITHHSFRRGLATYLIEKGADIKATQYLLRHKSERTTLRYYVAVNKKRAKMIHQRILSRGFGA